MRPTGIQTRMREEAPIDTCRTGNAQQCTWCVINVLSVTHTLLPLKGVLPGSVSNQKYAIPVWCESKTQQGMCERSGATPL